MQTPSFVELLATKGELLVGFVGGFCAVLLTAFGFGHKWASVEQKLDILIDGHKTLQKEAQENSRDISHIKGYLKIDQKT